MTRRFFKQVLGCGCLMLGFVNPVLAAPIDLARPTVIQALKHDVSLPLRELARLSPLLNNFPEIPNQPLDKVREAIKREDNPAVQQPDAVLQDRPGSLQIPNPILNFDGISNVNGVLPPDSNGAVGLNHYFQWVNLSFAIYNKSGTRLVGPAAGSSLWSGFGGPCQTSNDGDPVALYDHLADRWMVSQFALPNFPVGPYYQCIAVSTTGDPTGTYYRYAFTVSNNKLNDYPKLGIWPDGYYMTANQFRNGVSFAGAGVWSFEREKMLQGLPAQLVYFDLERVNPNFGGILPADLDGPAPPVGTPNYFAEVDDAAFGFPMDQLALWEFRVDWTDPTRSTFGLAGQPNQLLTPATGLAAFDANLCNGNRNCIPQAGTTRRLDAIADRLLYRLQYRNFGTHQAMVLNHTVDATGTDLAGIRWYELRNTGGGWSIFQQSTFAPSRLNRWMGSIAMDGSGNIGLGYSASSSRIFPSIGYTGRLSTDPLGTLQAENILIRGGGAQTSSSSRWGDYSTLTVDPSDNCTFWYTTEYYAQTSAAGWRTRIGTFRFPSCTGAP
ncbi:hypothetical protein [Anthocerotibacter panamensis]|uniref:hypothetical protein n=1 Tax=Anthocerotibacter panamensis TaxID=2857077 RepID=UPI001C403784|nr:hypothetical protein [Anthocerotibacter panamensis]